MLVLLLLDLKPLLLLDLNLTYGAADHLFFGVLVYLFVFDGFFTLMLFAVSALEERLALDVAKELFFFDL